MFVALLRAFGRIGNAYSKQEKFKEAIEAYNKSLIEHRSADVLKKLQEVRRFISDKLSATPRAHSDRVRHAKAGK